ncbi:peptide mating pheromone precursor Bbp2-5 [Schizophyllum commune H4-8]|uniref:Peptide mating pheromone Bbp2-5 n=2 Tax=Schizophyllum commune TaxID=5334 RepID=Q96TS2_SCHCO|nr:peptide mating pheromone precursor Bbp2-5 [Schizophyllum commune H4-8]AAK58070.1 peptide mating pheromone precursor Bbp2-5 [Schizophyllum commune]KAI5887468.1 peptide mating pheromone precursor Bbp2-5 [Schizophyllum commune H4-8]
MDRPHTKMAAFSARTSSPAPVASTIAFPSTRTKDTAPSTSGSSTPTRPASATPRAPDADLLRLLADARSAIARPPQDADEPDGYFAGYCVVM